MAVPSQGRKTGFTFPHQLAIAAARPRQEACVNLAQQLSSGKATPGEDRCLPTFSSPEGVRPPVQKGVLERTSALTTPIHVTSMLKIIQWLPVLLRINFKVISGLLRPISDLPTDYFYILSQYLPHSFYFSSTGLMAFSQICQSQSYFRHSYSFSPPSEKFLLIYHMVCALILVRGLAIIFL